MDSDFEDKLLCDGPTFSTGSACVFSCAFCYVDDLMRKNPHTQEIRDKGIPFEEAVIRREGAIDAVRQHLLDAEGFPKYKNPYDTRVIYASPLVDVAANMDLVRETADVCSLVLEHTNWQIRLLSKSSLLPKLAALIDIKWKERVIYGVSTGTLNDGLAKAFEKGTALVSKRIESLHELQDNGYRTFGMICPSLPQDDYDKFAREMAEAIRVEHCEHVWAEVMNVRGKSFIRTIQALKDKGFDKEAELLKKVQDANQWEQYAQSTFLAHSRQIPPKKFRFLQYFKKPYLDWWKSHEGMGAVLLGAGAKRPLGKTLSKAKQARFIKLDAKITKAAKDFVEAGLALHEIKVDKLYLAKFDTYEEYCQSVLAMSRQHANNLIRAGRAVKQMETIVSKEGLPLPENEGQVRELCIRPNIVPLVGGVETC